MDLSTIPISKHEVHPIRIPLLEIHHRLTHAYVLVKAVRQVPPIHELVLPIIVDPVQLFVAGFGAVRLEFDEWMIPEATFEKIKVAFQVRDKGHASI